MSGSAPTLPSNAAGSTPLYQQVKDYVRGAILTGAWPVDHRVPSESELVRLSGASRMTVHRALRELKDDGWLRRVQGQGTFVADRRARLDLLEIRNIADVIRSRGTYGCDVVLHERSQPPIDIAEELETEPGADLFHSRLVHLLDGVPFQLEDRWVNPAAAPDYLGIDLTRQTPQRIPDARRTFERGRTPARGRAARPDGTRIARHRPASALPAVAPAHLVRRPGRLTRLADPSGRPLLPGDPLRPRCRSAAIP